MNQQIIEMNAIKGSNFELMKRYGSNFYINAFYGSKEDILNLFSVRNKTVTQTVLKDRLSSFDSKNLFYIELVTPKDIDSEVVRYSFQNGNKRLNRFELFYENLVIYNNRTIEYIPEKEEPNFQSQRIHVPFRKIMNFIVIFL